MYDIYAVRLQKFITPARIYYILKVPSFGNNFIMS